MFRHKVHRRQIRDGAYLPRGVDLQLGIALQARLSGGGPLAERKRSWPRLGYGIFVDLQFKPSLLERHQFLAPRHDSAAFGQARYYRFVRAVGPCGIVEYHHGRRICRLDAVKYGLVYLDYEFGVRAVLAPFARVVAVRLACAMRAVFAHRDGKHASKSRHVPEELFRRITQPAQRLRVLGAKAIVRNAAAIARRSS